ncbi:MAG: hypothetical protein LBQ66_06190 [Planctomycetaceae bacterium]|nr:hypothetical protein [Planctomycetaceae bacterium]
MFSICILSAFHAERVVLAQNFDMLRLSSSQLRAEVILRNNFDIYRPDEAVIFDVCGSLAHTRNLPQLWNTTPSKISKNILVHVAVYKIPEPNGQIITPNSKRSDPTKSSPEYESELNFTISSDTPFNLPITFLAPKKDGVYELIVSIYPQNQTPLPRRFAKPEKEISKQFVIASTTPPESITTKNLQTKNNNQTLTNSTNYNTNHNPQNRQLTNETVAQTQNNHTATNNTNQLQTTKITNNPHELLDTELLEPAAAVKSEWWHPTLKRLPAIPSPRLTGLIEWNSAAHATVQDTFHFAINKKPLESFFEQNSAPITNTPKDVTKNDNNNTILHASELSPTWFIETLSVRDIGKPHLLEIDYPNGVPQKLEVAVVETLDNEYFVSAESCINVTKNIATNIAQLKQTGHTTHRILFWAKTKSPIVLFVNRTKQNCYYNNIRLYRIKSESIPHQYNSPPKRLVAGYLNRPESLLQFASTVEKTSVTNVTNTANTTNTTNAANTPNEAAPKMIACDWQTIYEAATRLVDMTRWNGFDGIMVNVASKSNVMYRSDLYRNADEYEPPRDVLELLHRLFDREMFFLIPSVNFNMRLTKVDVVLQNNPELAEEILSANMFLSDKTDAGKSDDNSQNTTPRRYNLFHPVVKNAMLEVIGELAARYGQHPSFGGLGVILSHDSYVILSEPLRSLDDWTIREFTRESGIFVPNANSSNLRERVTAREKFFRENNAAFDAFIKWRNKKVKEFYQDAIKIINNTRPDARLYLAGDAMLDQSDVRQFCLPSLPRSNAVYLSQRMLGYDSDMICEIPAVTFLRPSRSSPEMQNESAAVYSDFDTAYTGSQFIRSGISFGTLFFNDPDESPVVPASFQNRYRFVKQLAQSDVAMFFDGGSSIISGENESLRDLFAVFRQLPPLPFNTFNSSTNLPPNQPDLPAANSQQPNAIISPASSISPKSADRSFQPITVRYVSDASGLFVYLVNDAPFDVRVDMEIRMAEGAGLRELSGRKKIETGIWIDGKAKVSFRLDAYDLFAINVGDATARIENLDVLRPEYICGTGGLLQKTVEELGQRIQIAKSGIKWNKLINAGFDESDAKNFAKSDLPKNEVPQNIYDQIPLIDNNFSPGKFNAAQYSYGEVRGWRSISAAKNPAVAVIDSVIKHSGKSSLKLVSVDANRQICVSSEPFELPATGRLFVSFFVGMRESDIERVNNSFKQLNSATTANTMATTTTNTAATATNLTAQSSNVPGQKSAADAVGGVDLDSAVMNSVSRVPLSFRVLLVESRGGNSREFGAVDNGKMLMRDFNAVSVLHSLFRQMESFKQTDAGGVRWVKVVIPFDRLPLDDCREVMLCFNFGGEAMVWVDDISLYQVAFTPEESNELFKLLSAADVRRIKYRVSDLMMLQDSYWAQFLMHNVPIPTQHTDNINNDNSKNINLANRTTTTVTPITRPNTNNTTKPKNESQGFMRRIKSWLPWQ